MKTLTLNQAIDRLMRNDRNATWDEVETVEDLRDGLTDALTGYDVSEPHHAFLLDTLNRLEA